MTFLKGNGGPHNWPCVSLRLVTLFRSQGIMGLSPGLVKASSQVTLFLILWAAWDFGPGQLMIVLTTNRIKVWVSLVPAAAVIPAHLVFFIIVVVKKFLAIDKLALLVCRKSTFRTFDICVKGTYELIEYIQQVVIKSKR